MSTDEKDWQEIVADDIACLSHSIKKLNEGPLKKRTIILLLKDVTGLSLKDCEIALDGIEHLKDHFIKDES